MDGDTLQPAEDTFSHRSVLLEETIELLNVRPDGVYVDGTIGGGGHSLRIAEKLDPAAGGKLIGFDQDDEAIRAAGERLAPVSERVTILRDNYENAPARLAEIGIRSVDGILLDLGVSSRQFDSAQRGFSYRMDGPLDMRMDRRQSLTAEEIVNSWTEEEITHILRDYGEERFAAAIAKRIVQERAERPIRTTGELNELIDRAIPAKIRARDASHPARKTYQALRIACNRELDVLRTALDTFADLLAPHGRFAVITFHSLEDRMVKQAFRTWENPCICPPGFPVCTCGKKPVGRVITKKPVMPDEEETTLNRRARSAKLRVFERN